MSSELRVDKIVPTDGVPTGGGGGIIQVKQSLYNSYITKNNSSFEAISGFTVAMTPKFNTRKILITLNLLLEVRSASIVSIELTRGGTSIFTNEGGMRCDGTAQGGYVSMTYLDSPASTSSLTYGVQTRSSNGNYTFNNYTGGGPANSFLTLMEVSA